MKKSDKELLDSAIKLLSKPKKRKEKKIPKVYKLENSVIKELDKLANEYDLTYNQLFKKLLTQHYGKDN